jgi:hypothetical protein
MNLSDLRKLLSETGFDCLDATASALGRQPLPSEVAKPLTSPAPERLQQAQDDWWWAAERIDEHKEALQTAVSSVLANWEAPEEFQNYMTKMMAVLEDQKTAMEDVSRTILAIRTTLQNDKNEAFNRATAAAIAIWGIAAGAVAGIGVAIFTGELAAPAVIASAATALVSILAAMLYWLASKENSQRSETGGLSAQLSNLQGLVNQVNLPKISPPAMPDLSNVKSFRSIHESA